MSKKGEILIVDDDPDFCEIARTTLEAHGFSVRCACTGDEGLAFMREEKPDLVFLDVIMVMPDEGVYVSQQMAQDPELRDIPVVMVSSILESDYGGHFPTDQTLHVHQFIDKPVPLRKLVQVAEDLVGQKKTTA